MTGIPLELSSAERLSLGHEVLEFLDDWIAPLAVIRQPLRSQILTTA